MSEDKQTTSSFRYELLRDHVLPSILGKHEGDILYWAGKELARKFPVDGIEEIRAFFMKAGWGHLQERKTGKKEAFYVLKKSDADLHIGERNFQLEAGFLAEQFQTINGLLTECYAKSDSKNNMVEFQLAWDRKVSVQ